MGRDFSFTILDVCEKAGIDTRKYRAGRKNFDIVCPNCGDAMGVSAVRNNFHCYHCDVSGGMLDLYRLATGVEDNSAAYAAMMGDGVKTQWKPREILRSIPVESPLAPIETRSKTYGNFLASLPLATKHRNNLIKRGLTADTIMKNGYKTIPQTGAKAIAAALVATGCTTRGVPGFYESKTNGRPLLRVYAAGFYIPVRDVYGNIAGMQMRMDDPKEFALIRELLTPCKDDEPVKFAATKFIAQALKIEKGSWVTPRVRANQGAASKDEATKKAEALMESIKDRSFGRYQWFSGQPDKDAVNGSSADGGQVHFAGVDVKNPPETVYITEGPLKADILYENTGRACIALAGVTNTSHLAEALETLKNLGVKQVVTAFDMDQFVNDKVRAAVEHCNEIANASGLIVLPPLRWNPKYKGIDDFVARNLGKQKGNNNEG